jgi:hypothetical protein
MKHSRLVAVTLAVVLNACGVAADRDAAPGAGPGETLTNVPLPAEGECLLRWDCAPGFHCFRPDGCELAGECRDARGAQGGEDASVFGCDGGYYRSVLAALQAGADFDFEFTTQSPTSPCSVNSDCGSGRWCEHQPGWCGELGTCVASPQRCGAGEPYDVCGCDGTTYASACAAAVAGASVSSIGACTE